MRDHESIRILHVVGGMNRGGTETWLMHVLRHTRHDQFQMDFLVHSTKPSAYDEEIRALGGRIIPCLHPQRPMQYAHALRQVLEEHGPFQIVHSHVHLFTGFVLRTAQAAGVSTRIAHSHSDTRPLQAQAGLTRRVYLRLMKRWIAQYATLGLADSHQAAAALFGEQWQNDPRWRILPCTIDFSPFHESVTSADVRQELGIDRDAFVVGHVGRFLPVKNHAFLVQVAAELVKRHPNTVLLLVGDGSLRYAIEQQVAAAGLQNQVVFTGVRPDVARLMRAMDVFVLPSLYEGVPLVALEAQAAGLPTVVSDGLPPETDEIPQLVQRYPLTLSPALWADELLAIRVSGPKISAGEALSRLEQSPFNIQKGVRDLENTYLEQLQPFAIQS